MKNAIVFLPRYSSYGASSRYRSYAIKNAFYPREKIAPFFSYSRFKNLLYPVYFLRRVFVLIFYRESVFYVEGDFFPYLPINFLLPRRYILDYDDAVWYSEKVPFQFIHVKYSALISKAEHIVVGSHYLQRFICEHFNGYDSRIFWIPTTFSKDKFIPKSSFGKDKILCGWIGSPSTSPFIDKVLTIIQNERLDVKVLLVGYQGSFANASFVDCLEWSEDNELLFLEKVDIGLSPLLPGEFAMGKCGFKVVQYFSMGLPVIADDYPPNAQFCIEGHNGILCRSNQDWVDALKNLNDLNLFRIGRMNRMSFDSICLEEQQNTYEKILGRCVE